MSCSREGEPLGSSRNLGRPVQTSSNGIVARQVDRLDLEGLDETLGLGVVERVAASVHRPDQLAIARLGVLGSAVGMADASGRRSAISSEPARIVDTEHPIMPAAHHSVLVSRRPSAPAPTLRHLWRRPHGPTSFEHAGTSSSRDRARLLVSLRRTDMSVARLRRSRDANA